MLLLLQVTGFEPCLGMNAQRELPKLSLGLARILNTRSPMPLTLWRGLGFKLGFRSLGFD